MSTETVASPPAAAGPAKTRAQALRSYDVADFPPLTGREEEWRFTPLARLRGLAKADGGSALGSAATSVQHGDLPEGVRLESVGRDDPRIGSVLAPFDRISALAYGQFSTASVIQIERGAVVAEPAVVSIVGDKNDDPDFGHMFIDVGAVSEATLVLEYSGSATLADNVEVSIGQGANLTLVTVTDWAPDAVQAQHLKFRLGRDAKLTHIQVTLGGDLVRQYTSVDYAGRGGDAELYGLFFATAPADSAGEKHGQHFEHRLLVDHGVPDCTSYVGYRGALQGDGAHTVWVGDVLIRAEATGTKTYEINRNLVLSDGARADSVPNLEIETGEVVGAGHASTTGRFDDEQLFYLMARGIPEDQARRLVVRGFFAELIDKIPVETLRERLSAAIEERLAGAGV
jgi:Fe-S cluster assembly protein SufD